MRLRDFIVPQAFGIAPPGLVLPPPELKAKLEEKEKSREREREGVVHGEGEEPSAKCFSFERGFAAL